MAKPKSPLLSLEARGTIGDTLTYQKRGTSSIVREKPIPKDPYTLNQAYQRWDYRDYAYLWTLLSNSEKQVYRTKASRYHITGFSQWMRENLKALTGLAARWHLDNITDNQVLDSSRNSNHATVIGAMVTPGRINNGLYFDGLNDELNAGTDPSIRITADLSIEGFFRTTKATSTLIQKWDSPANNRSYAVPIRAGKLEPFVSHNGIAFTSIAGTTPVDDGSIHHFCFQHEDGVGLSLFIDGQEDTTPVAHTTGIYDSQAVTPLRIGRDNWGFFLDLLDHIAIRSFLLPPALIKIHSERRYPA